MDVFFETQKGTVYEIEVGYFDTILEIKEKIKKYKEIPIAHQTLIFNGKILEDDLEVQKSEILHHSRVRLIVVNGSNSPEKTKIVVKSEQVSRRVQILLRISKTKQASVEVDLNDCVEKLKEKINEIDGISIPSNRLVLAHGNIEMQDKKQIRDYNLIDGSEVDVSVKPAPVLSPASVLMAHASRKLRVFVLPKCGTNKIMMEVNFTDKIQVMRGELEKLQQRTTFRLPTDGYFFIYKQNVMEENESFLWHRVRHGETIEIFNGSVSGGS